MDNTLFCNSFWSRLPGDSLRDAGAPEKDIMDGIELGKEGYKRLTQRIHESTASLKKLKAFYKDRAEMEEEYAKKLAKQAKSHPLVGEAETGHLAEALKQVSAQTEYLSKMHHVQSKFSKQNADRVDHFVKWREHQINEIQGTVDNLWKQRSNTTNITIKALEKYRDTYVSIRSLRAQASVTQGKAMSKNLIKLERAESHVDGEMGDALQSTAALNDVFELWNGHWRAYCDMAQAQEEARAEFLKINLWDDANATSTMCMKVDAAAERVRVALEQIEPPREMAIFLHGARTGHYIPQPPPFVDFTKQERAPVQKFTKAAFMRVGTSRVDVQPTPLEEISALFDAPSNVSTATNRTSMISERSMGDRSSLAVSAAASVADRSDLSAVSETPTRTSHADGNRSFDILATPTKTENPMNAPGSAPPQQTSQEAPSGLLAKASRALNIGKKSKSTADLSEFQYPTRIETKEVEENDAVPEIPPFEEIPALDKSPRLADDEGKNDDPLESAISKLRLSKSMDPVVQDADRSVLSREPSQVSSVLNREPSRLESEVSASSSASAHFGNPTTRMSKAYMEELNERKRRHAMPTSSSTPAYLSQVADGSPRSHKMALDKHHRGTSEHSVSTHSRPASSLSLVADSHLSQSSVELEKPQRSSTLMRAASDDDDDYLAAIGQACETSMHNASRMDMYQGDMSHMSHEADMSRSGNTSRAGRTSRGGEFLSTISRKLSTLSLGKKDKDDADGTLKASKKGAQADDVFSSRAQPDDLFSAGYDTPSMHAQAAPMHKVKSKNSASDFIDSVLNNYSQSLPSECGTSRLSRPSSRISNISRPQSPAAGRASPAPGRAPAGAFSPQKYRGPADHMSPIKYRGPADHMSPIGYDRYQSTMAGSPLASKSAGPGPMHMGGSPGRMSYDRGYPPALDKLTAQQPQYMYPQGQAYGYRQPDPQPQGYGYKQPEPQAYMQEPRHAPHVIFCVRALYDYSPQTPEEFPFTKGDKIAVTGTDPDGWWNGYLTRNRSIEGIFPSNFVRPI